MTGVQTCALPISPDLAAAPPPLPPLPPEFAGSMDSNVMRATPSAGVDEIGMAEQGVSAESVQPVEEVPEAQPEERKDASAAAGGVPEVEAITISDHALQQSRNPKNKVYSQALWAYNQGSAAAANLTQAQYRAVLELLQAGKISTSSTLYKNVATALRRSLRVVKHHLHSLKRLLSSLKKTPKSLAPLMEYNVISRFRGFFMHYLNRATCLRACTNLNRACG